VRQQSYDGVSNDLLTAGLGKSGLQAPRTRLANPLQPTAAELRRAAITTTTAPCST
jgi:hydroxybutyrate-dimer hydrolase